MSMDTKQLLDSLADHMALYHRASSQSGDTRRSQYRINVMRWMSSLTPQQRQAALTTVDEHWLAILLQMRDHVLRHGHGFFILLPDMPDRFQIPSSSRSLQIPSLCYRKARGLLARDGEDAEAALTGSVLLFSSSDGNNDATELRPLDTLTVSEEFVSDVNRFVKVMDSVSNSEFLMSSSNASSSSWDELPWLKAKGFYSLGSFVANRIELSLGLSWMHSRLKKRSGPPRSGTGNARDDAFSAFWRKKGVIDWWCQLDPATRSRAFQLALSKASKLEVQRLFQDGNQESFMMNPEKEVTMSVRSPKQCILQSITGVSSNNVKNKHFSLLKNGFRDTSSTDQIANGLSVLEEITSTMSLRSVVVPENSVLFLSTLCSAHTVVDNTMRRIRDLFSKVSSESLEFDLLKEEKLICQVIKPTVVQRKEKSRKARRAKKKFACNKNMTEEGSLPKENNKVGPAYQRLDKHLQNGVSVKEISQIPTHEGGSNSSNDMLKSQSRVEVANANKAQTQKRRSKAKKKRNNNLDGKPSMSNIENKLDTCKLETEDNDSLICPEQKLACSSMEVVKNKNSNSPAIPGSCFGNTKDMCVGNTVNVSVQEQLVKNDKCCSLVKCNSFSLENSVSKNHGSSEEQCSGEKSCLGYKDGQASEKSSIPSEQSKSDNNLENCCNETSFSCIDRDDKLKRGSSHTQFRYDRQKLFLPTSYEWPGALTFRLPSTSNQMLPTTSDRLHLEVGWNWHHPQPPIVALKQPWQRNSLCHGGYKGRNICPQPSKNNDWAQVLNEGCSASSSVIYPIEGGKNPIIQVACVSNAKDSIGNIKPKDCPGHETIEESYCDDAAYSSCNGDEMEGYSVSDDETEKYPAKNALHFSDYSKYFGGGVMYWNTADYAGTGYSRPPSLSSEDSSWARHEDDLKVAIEDIVSVPPIPSPYSNSGLSSPGTAFFSPFEQFNPVNPSTHAGFAKSGNDLTANLISPGALEEQDSMSSLKGSNKVADGIKNDMLSYPILRPIVIPSMSRRASRKDLSNIKESRSSCTSSRRREGSSLKRPPSPVVLCVPSPPPPSPVRGFRKQRCFPPVRSGSSSPRHWGINSRFSEAETEVDEKCLPIGHAKVAGFSLGAKYITGTPPMHNVGNIHTDCLVTISNIPLEDKHPDITLPLQSPEIENNPSIQTALAKLHNILHEEIECFCKKIASENQRRKPFVNAAVDKVTRALQVLWPRSRTKIFGSIATGLALPSSDVDVVVCLPPVRNLEPIKEAGILEGRNGIKETCLQHAARYLADQDWVKTDSLKTIENTAIPIIMLVVKLPSQHSYKGFTVGEVQERRNELLRGCEQRHISGIGISAYSSGDIRACEGSCASWSDNEQLESVRLDISFESASHTGLRTASLVRDLTGKFPAIIPLALVFKQFLTDRCLDHPYSGGLSSYCLVLLITRFLQHQHHAGRSINQNLGRLFLDFLYFFGCVFDPRQMRISIYGSGMYVNRGRAQSIDPLHIDDPLDDPIYPVNNVGRNCFRIHQCIKAFADAHSILKRELLSLDFLNISDSNHCRVLQKVIPSFGDLNKRKT